MAKATTATIVSDATTVDPGEAVLKPNSSTPGQTEVSLPVWEGEGIRAGIWEVSPGTFKSKRDGYDELCQILSGSATITEANGNSFDVAAGSFFVTPAGWEGSWAVHETLRKVWVIHDAVSD
ncbi:cupin domain-containing protein [Nocardia sp. NPDC059239]|uniref:cupin domain-containing protein n=1 Tax=Nocardia sp. NPDC059239 TaxID=3346785 RepID=UPI0036CDF04A